MDKRKIFIVEDEFIVANDIKNTLEDMDYAVAGIAASGERAIRRIETEKPDLVLMDIMLRGQMNGIEAAKAIYSSFNIPVVFLTAYTGQGIIDQAREAKPFGYLVKSFENRQLKATIDIALDKFQAEEKIKHLALHDSLTNLPNRNLLDDRLTRARCRAYRYQHFVAVFYIDIDEFGAVNKTCGQESGDSVLKTVAERLKSAIRKTDTAARIGGDEFVVVLQEVRKREDAEEVAKKLLHELSQPIHTDEKECTVSASIGISIYPYDGLDNDTLRKKADKAMHQVKKSGKNNYMFCDFPEDDSEDANARDSSEGDFFLPFQAPLISNGEVFHDRMTFTNSPLKGYRNFAALLYVEADSFDDMNEKFGYDAGNRIFREIANRLKRSVRNADTLARIGKDKFVIILEQIQKKEDAEEVAKTILRTLNEPIRVNGKSCMLHIRIGISIYPYDGLDNTTLLKKADQAIREKEDFESTYYFCDFSTEADAERVMRDA